MRGGLNHQPPLSAPPTDPKELSGHAAATRAVAGMNKNRYLYGILTYNKH